MDQHTVSIDLPSDIFLALNESETELKQRIKLILAIRLYKIQKLSLGKAAELAGLSRLEFETALSENEISLSFLSSNEVFKDAEKLKG